jgi:hypothetical protein
MVNINFSPMQKLSQQKQPRQTKVREEAIEQHARRLREETQENQRAVIDQEQPNFDM